MSVAHSFRRSAAALLIAGLSFTPAMANDWLKAKQPHLQVTTEKSVASDAVTAAPEAGSSEAWQRAKHPALLMVDTISGLASAEYRHDEWGVDVAVSGSQKGLMLPPGISFNALSPRAIEATASWQRSAHSRSSAMQ